MDTEELISKFQIKGELIKIKQNNEGHINTTFMSTFNDDGIIKKYTHQKINKFAFKKPDHVMENITNITNHIQSKIKDMKDKEKRCLEVVFTKDNKPYFIDKNGDYFRTYKFIDNVRTYQKIDNCNTAFHLGEAISTFQNQLSDFDCSSLYDTIPNFHDMRMRYKSFKDAIIEDKFNRVKLVKNEIDYLLANEERGYIIIDEFKNNKLPLRVIHNDTKINNVLFNCDGSEALSVIDLDTVMAGTILFDTGDMIRTATSTIEEDDINFQNMSLNLDYFKSLLEGYLSIASEYLTKREKELIVESGRNITQIMAVRFLTDYISGDVYYSISKENHNVDRCRTQIAFMKDFDKKSDALNQIIKELYKKLR
ncbi:MAG: phosphotransferase [Spirochaetaceae bacterium]|nr:phosphotransferase [Spirochaetaceae bacterium]